MAAVVQSLWVGDTLSRIEELSVGSFVANGADYHLYTYGPVANVPAGATVRDAAELIPESEVFTTHNGSYALFSDLFRWTLLYERGGYWADTDMVCLKTFDFTDELVFGRENDRYVNTALLGVPAGHSLAELMLDCARSPFKVQAFDDRKSRRRKFRCRLLGTGYQSAKWGEVAGPGGFTRALRHFGLFDQAKSHMAFYPINAMNWDAIFDDTFSPPQQYFEKSYAIHMWNEMMRRRSGFDKNARFAENSLFEELYRRFL